GGCISNTNKPYLSGSSSGCRVAGAITCAPVSADRVRSSRLYAEQERALAHYVRREVYPYSAYYRRVFDDAGLGAKAVRTTADLSRFPLTTVDSAAANVGATVLTADA